MTRKKGPVHVQDRCNLKKQSNEQTFSIHSWLNLQVHGHRIEYICQTLLMNTKTVSH